MHRDEPRILGPLPGPEPSAWLARDDAVMSPSYTRVYPLVVRRAQGAMIEDLDGNRFLDFTAGIAVTAAGHCHPEVVAAIREQAGRLIHMSGTDFYYTPQVRLAERLARLAPGAGPEAGLLHQQRGRGDRGGPEAGAPAHRPAPRAGVPRRLPRPDLRRDVAERLEADPAPGLRARWCPRSTTPATATSRASAPCCATVCPPDELAAIFVEPIQGEGGYIVPPARLPARPPRGSATSTASCSCSTRSSRASAGPGKMFASEHWGVAGDIVCLAKGIANGLPLGAIVARADVMDWPSGSHASTFGGNPVACAAALATLRLVETRYRANAERRGARAAARACRELAARHPLDPRGPRARA